MLDTEAVLGIKQDFAKAGEEGLALNEFVECLLRRMPAPVAAAGARAAGDRRSPAHGHDDDGGGSPGGGGGGGGGAHGGGTLPRTASFMGRRLEKNDPVRMAHLLRKLFYQIDVRHTFGFIPTCVLFLFVCC